MSTVKSLLVEDETCFEQYRKIFSRITVKIFATFYILVSLYVVSSSKAVFQNILTMAPYIVLSRKRSSKISPL